MVGLPGAAPGEPVADAVGDGVAGLDDADGVGVGVGRAVCRLAGMDGKSAEAVGGALATTARNGRPPHAPSAGESQVADVCMAVTRPEAGGGAEPKAWAR